MTRMTDLVEENLKLRREKAILLEEIAELRAHLGKLADEQQATILRRALRWLRRVRLGPAH